MYNFDQNDFPLDGKKIFKRIQKKTKKSNHYYKVGKQAFVIRVNIIYTTFTYNQRKLEKE